MRKIIIMHATVTNHDAIGNDIERMHQILSEKNECYVFAINQLNDNVPYISLEQLQEVVEKEDTVIIYHHSVFWELGEEILDKCKGKIIIRYHNITPAEFFEKYDEFAYNQCKHGREQTERFIVKYPEAIWLSASKYNLEEIHDIAENMLFVCPPFHKIEEWKKTMPHEQILHNLLYDNRLSVLFVGRIAPNKGHTFLFKVLSCYCENYDRSIVLRIVGKKDESLKRYTEELMQHIRCYDIEANVQFIGDIDDAKLLAYYLGSDVFLCASEHEGFCVPILEAQGCELPIIARNLCAVPDTLGWGQLLLDEDVKEYAAALHEIKTNKKLVEYLRMQGVKNYDSYTDAMLAKKFTDFMTEEVGIQI